MEGIAMTEHDNGMLIFESAGALSSAPMISEAILESAEHQVQMQKRLMCVIIKRTYQSDWVDFSGKPWLTDAGAERIASLLGVCIEVFRDGAGKPVFARDDHEDPSGRYYVIRVWGRASRGGQWVDVDGCASSRQSLLGTVGGAPKPVEAVDRVAIERMAIRDLHREGVTVLLGLRGLTWNILEDSGYVAESAQKAEFRSGSKGGGKRTEDVSAVIAKYDTILREFFLSDENQIGDWVENATSFEGRDGSIVRGKRSLSALTEKQIMHPAFRSKIEALAKSMKGE